MSSPRQFPFELLERQMLYRNRHVADLGHHGILHLEGALDVDVARRAVRLCADIFPVLGCYVEERLWGLRWVEREDKDRLVWLDVVTSEDVDAEVDRYLRIPCEPWNRDPVFTARIIRARRGDTFILKIHHAAADGIGMKEMGYVFAANYRALVADPRFAPKPSPYRRDLGQILGALSRQRKLGILRGAARERAMTEQAGTVGLPLIVGDPRTWKVLSRRIPKDKFRKLRNYARNRNKASFHDLMNALLAYAVLVHFGGAKPAPVRIRNPVDLRRYNPACMATEGPRNLASFATFDIAPRACELDAVLEECRSQLHSQFVGEMDCPGLGAYPKMRARDLLPNRILTESVDRRWAKAIELHRRGVPIRLPLVVSNGGLLEKKRLQMPGVSVLDASPISIGYNNHCYFAFTVFDSQVTLVVRFCDPEGMGPHIEALLGIVDEQIERICDAAKGEAPSADSN